MVLPLYLAVTGAEMPFFSDIPSPMAFLACQFSPYTQGLANIPDRLPDGSILILTDRTPCQGHSADLVAGQLQDIVDQNHCDSLLLDFQRPPEPEAEQMVRTILKQLNCPVAVSEGFAEGLSCPVFLSPAPLHRPLQEHLAPWEDREIWLEAALCQEDIVVTEDGPSFHTRFPADALTDGFYDEILRCQYRIKADNDRITFTLFDTSESLHQKLELARTLGVSRSVGLYQELG